MGYACIASVLSVLIAGALCFFGLIVFPVFLGAEDYKVAAWWGAVLLISAFVLSYTLPLSLNAGC